MTKIVPSMILVLAGLLLTRELPARAQAPRADGAQVLAEIGDQRILWSDFVGRLSDERRRGMAANNLEAFTAAAKQAALDKLIDTSRLATEARSRAIDRRPDVQHRIDVLVNELLAQALLDDIAAAADDPSVLRAYYAAHPEQFKNAGRVRARHIVVKTEAEAMAARGRLLRSQDFARLADELNIDATKGKGGELGWIRQGLMVPAFERAVFGLRVGEIGPIVQTSYGFHIGQVEEIDAAKPKPYELVAVQVRQRVVDGEIATTKAELAKKHPARINSELLGSIR
jgi:peptidyl-prolyl cis-trans isomerase C